MYRVVEQNVTLESVVARLKRAEFSGALAQTLVHKGQGDFALLLSMLVQDVTQQLQFSEQPEEGIKGNIPIEQFNYYPEIPLSTETKHYAQQQAFADAVHREDIKTASLLGCMFPSPLSLHNDPKRVDDNVMANCDIYTQSRMQVAKAGEAGDTAKNEDIEVDPTLLYDTIAAAQDVQAA